MDFMDMFKQIIKSEMKLGPAIGPLTAEELAEKAIIDSQKEALTSRARDLKLDMEGNEVANKIWWRKVERARNLSNQDLRINNGILYSLISEEKDKGE